MLRYSKFFYLPCCKCYPPIHLRGSPPSSMLPSQITATPSVAPLTVMLTSVMSDTVHQLKILILTFLFSLVQM